jgi:hypothetical protein
MAPLTPFFFVDGGMPATIFRNIAQAAAEPRASALAGRTEASYPSPLPIVDVVVGEDAANVFAATVELPRDDFLSITLY